MGSPAWFGSSVTVSGAVRVFSTPSGVVYLAVIVTSPIATPVAVPAEIVAKAVLLLVHVASLVTSESTPVPFVVVVKVRVNLNVLLTATLAFSAGEIDTL